MRRCLFGDGGLVSGLGTGESLTSYPQCRWELPFTYFFCVEKLVLSVTESGSGVGVRSLGGKPPVPACGLWELGGGLGIIQRFLGGLGCACEPWGFSTRTDTIRSHCAPPPTQHWWGSGLGPPAMLRARSFAGGARLGGTLVPPLPPQGLEGLMLPAELGPNPARRREGRTGSAPALLPLPVVKGRMRPQQHGDAGGHCPAAIPPREH